MCRRCSNLSGPTTIDLDLGACTTYLGSCEIDETLVKSDALLAVISSICIDVLDKLRTSVFPCRPHVMPYLMDLVANDHPDVSKERRATFRALNRASSSCRRYPNFFLRACDLANFVSAQPVSDIAARPCYVLIYCCRGAHLAISGGYCQGSYSMPVSKSQSRSYVISSQSCGDQASPSTPGSTLSLYPCANTLLWR